MARSRNIKPGFFRNELLAELDFGTRLLFIGLWTLADKAGRLEDRPKKIKIELFPADNVNVSCMIHALAKHEFITRYAVKGVRYIQINNFLKHQNPHHKEVDSELPGVESADLELEERADDSSGCANNNHAQSMHEPSMNHEQANEIASSPLIPDSGFLIPDTGEKTCAPGGACIAEPSKPEPENLYTDEFNEFWKAYPNKSGKKPAARAFKKLRARRSSRAFLDELIEDVTTRAKSFDWKKNNGQYIPMASTYLNQERWDDPAPVTTSDGVVRHLQNVPASREQRIHEQNVEIGRQWAARRRAQGE